MKKFKFPALIAILVCLLFSFWGYLGVWVPNSFGTGTLWLFQAILLSIWLWNTSIEEKK